MPLISSGFIQAVLSAILITGMLVLYLCRFASPRRWVAAALGLTVLDQAAKATVRRLLIRDGYMHTLSLLGGRLRIHYEWNSQQGFGGSSPCLFIGAAAFTAALLLLYRRLARMKYRMSALTEIACALIIAGLLGVLLDRVRLGYVVDFLDFGKNGNFVYNLADLCAFAAAALLAARAVQFLVVRTARPMGLPADGSDQRISACGAFPGPTPEVMDCPGEPALQARRKRRVLARAAARLSTPLMLASAVVLLGLIWDLDAGPRYPPLHEAALRGDTAAVERLLSKGADVNAVCQKAKYTALDLALAVGDAKVAKVLLAHGARLRQSALCITGSTKNPQLVRLLLSHGADVNAKCNDKTPLIHATIWGRSRGGLRLLLAAGAEVNAQDKSGCTALHHAAARRDAERARLLLAAGAHANARNHSGETPLHTIGGLAGALGGNSGREVAAVLVANGADVNAKAADGRTPLIRAVVKRDPDWVKLLLAAGADINARGPRGWTALHYAAAKDDTKVVRALLAAGGDVNARDYSGATPVHLARSKNVAELLEGTGRKS